MSLKSIWVCLVLALTHALCVYLGYFWLARKQSRVVLVVNGEMITKRDLDRALSIYREEALKSLGSQKVIAQAARRRKLTVADQELNLKGLADVDDDLRRARTEMMRSGALFRKLILADVSPADKQKIYDEFRPQLAQYCFSSFSVAEGVDLRRLLDDIAKKRSFEDLAKSYQKAGENSHLPESMTLEQIRTDFGPTGCQAIQQMEVNDVAGPVPSGHGPLVLRLERIKDSYKDVEPAIEEIAFRSRIRFYQYHLGVDSVITSLLPAEKTDEPKPDVPKGQDGLPVPNATGVATPKVLPAPDPTATVFPRGLPSPKSSGPGPKQLTPPAKHLPTPSYLPKLKPSAPSVRTLPPLRAPEGATPSPTPASAATPVS